MSVGQIDEVVENAGQTDFWRTTGFWEGQHVRTPGLGLADAGEFAALDHTQQFDL
jgi:hypothetical protein